MPDNQQVSWPGWEVTRVIGNGSFGAVYEIQRNTFGNVERAALKVISIPQNKSDIEELYNDGYDDASITARFNSYLEDIVKEYSLMVEMKGNTNVVYCDDLRYVQHEDGFGWDIYIKMELLTALTKVLTKDISEEQTIQLGIDICNALVLCKNRNIVHRDIKPQNIFVSKDGNYKLGDFGIAKTAERTTSGTKVGTYKYMAPEVYNNQPYGAGADIYSLGLVLYWMLNERRTPFLPLPPQVPTASIEDEARRRRFSGEVIPPPLHGSEELKRIVLKACAYDPKERYVSATDMLADLQALQKGVRIPVAPVAVAAVGSVYAAAEDLTEKMEPEEAEGTVNIFASRSVIHQIADEPTEYAREDKTEYIPRTPVATPQPPVEEKPKKKGAGRWIALLFGFAAMVALILMLLHYCGNQSTGPVENTKPSTEHTTNSEPTGEYSEPTVFVPVTFAVPDVTGMEAAQGQEELEALGFKVELTYQQDDDVAEGKIISQSVEPDTQLEAGGVIALVISSGKPTIELKDVSGMERDAAKGVLEAQGFKVIVEERFSSDIKLGAVIAQSPQAGSDLLEGAEVLIYVSKGKAPVPVTGVSINKASLKLTVGSTERLVATVTPAGADNKTVTWSSSNMAVVKVSADGLVTAVSAGNAVVTVKTVDGGMTATISVTVVNPSVNVTLNVNGGNGGNTSTTVKANEQYGTLPTPKRDYYNFKGWYTAATGGRKVTATTLVTTQSAHSLYAQWELKPLSGWVLASDAPSSAQIVNKKWTYTKTTYKESNQSTMSGYTLYNTVSTWGEYGAWSAWSKTAATSSDSRQVETKTVTDQAGYTQYRYWRYKQNGASRIHWCATLGKNYWGGTWYQDYTSWSNSPKAVYDSSYGKCSCHGSVVAYGTSSNLYYWEETRWIPAVTHTEYRYRDRVRIYTYYFVKQENLESTTEVTASDTITNVKAYVQYREK